MFIEFLLEVLLFPLVDFIFESVLNTAFDKTVRRSIRYLILTVHTLAFVVPGFAVIVGGLMMLFQSSIIGGLALIIVGLLILYAFVLSLRRAKKSFTDKTP